MVSLWPTIPLASPRSVNRRKARKVFERFRIYGVTVDSQISLPGLPDPASAPELRVRWGDPGHNHPTYPEEVLANFSLSGVEYSVGRSASSYVIRYARTAEFVLDHDLKEISAHPHSERERALTTLLLAGNVFSVLLTLGGSCVLHASAIADDAGAICLVGPPGSGKSTLAALLCRAGFKLVTDDVLRLSPVESGFHCAPGSGALRLRGEAARLLSAWQVATSKSTDGRVVWTPERTSGDSLLRAIVFPRAEVGVPHPTLEQISPASALMELTRFPRVLGWKDSETIEMMFRWNAELARAVPCYIARVPLGPPLDRSRVEPLIALLQDDVPRQA